MATVATPTPFALHTDEYRLRTSSGRISQRPAPTRPHQARLSPVSLLREYNNAQIASNDSSDDEDLAPIKLSAEAQAILGEDNLNGSSDKENALLYSRRDSAKYQRSNIPNRRFLVEERQSPKREAGSPAPIVKHANASRPSPRTTFGRDGSFMYKIHEKSSQPHTVNDSKTPAPQIRRIRVSGSRSQTRSPSSSGGHKEPTPESGETPRAFPSPSDQVTHPTAGDDQPPSGVSTVTRPQRGEENGIHSTMRVRRIGTGTLLNRPVRRGMIRRPSDDEDTQVDYKPDEQDSPEIEQGRRAEEPELQNLPDELPISYGSPKHPVKYVARQLDIPAQVIRHSPTASSSKPGSSPMRPHVLANTTKDAKPTPLIDGLHGASKSSNSDRKPVFRIPSLPPLESVHDQENEPPPTFKRQKPSAMPLAIHEDVNSTEHEKEPLPRTMVSPSRPVLATRPSNTPHRPAPPPPKMSLIEAATSGANSRSKKSVHYVLNGRTYRRLDCIGRGGSSRVFRIMAENYKIFALKRVNLEEADMAAIAGYKGEIDLLQKLSNVDRVIRLFDYEVNEDKGVLNVMMELGESDFNKMLNEQLKGENAKLDITFTRHYWKEMLECVQSVHDHDIVHSDLKPANFLLVKGQLKLIDFGIANAIQDDTVNVHRENQIGTPNYMSPESLVCHTPAAGQATGTKLLKLGKPSDVWSLGCILYQMTYGQPPFAHITKQFERIMSIPNPKVEIKFPGIGIGGAVVPFGLIKTLRRCLQRDQSLRPTIKELLSEANPFLNPVAISPEMLGRVIGNVVGYCRKREDSLRAQGLLGQDGQTSLPKDEEMRGWPLAFYEKLRQAQAEGTAW